MDLELQNKIALVTGSSVGIGHATALSLAREGTDVVICARGKARLEYAANAIRAETGRTVLAIQADVTIPSDIEALVATTVTELGGIDILVNNAAGGSAEALFMDMTDEAWLNHINVKIMGYIRCTRQVIPHMRHRGGGRIVNIGGMAARRVGDMTASNGLNNSAVSNLSKHLADQVASDGILVNCVHPGPTRTPAATATMERRASKSGIGLKNVEAMIVEGIPIGRMVEAEDVANLVLFLASPLASAITGQSIAVEGGVGRGIHY